MIEKYLVINGGSIYTIGSAKGGDAGIDTDKGYEINGGIVIAMAIIFVGMLVDNTVKNQDEVERLLVRAKENGNLPKYLLMENVDALVSAKYIDSFNDWIGRLENLGFNSYYKCINAKDTGLPQTRNRIFVI